MPRALASLTLTLASLLAVNLAFARPAPSGPWDQLADDYINQYLAFSPTTSTQVGVHTHDAELDDYSTPSLAKQIAWLQQFEKRVLAFDAESLDATNAADREILLNDIRANLLELQVIRTFAKNPD